MSYFTGDEDNLFSGIVMAEKYIFANDSDGIFVWNMTDPGVEKLTGATNYKTKKILKFGGRLCLFNTVESGNACPQRVRWTAVEDAEDWTSAGSGFSDLITVLGSDEIMTAEKIGNFVAIYGERNIVLMEYKNDVNEPFTFISRVSGFGVASSRGVANLMDRHIFLALNDIYSYKGGRTVESVADGIREELLRIMNPEYISRSFLNYVKAEEEVRVHIPLADNSLPNILFRLDLKKGTWSRGTRTYSGYGSYKKVAAYTIDEMTNSIDSYSNLRFDDSSLLAVSPLNLYGNDSGVVTQDSTVVNDLADGSVVDGYWETKDFVVGEGYQKDTTDWMEINFEAKGDNVTVYYSSDFGETWDDGETFTLDNNKWDFYNCDVEEWAEQIRFRFRNNTAGETFSLRMIQVGFVASTSRETKED